MIGHVHTGNEPMPSAVEQRGGAVNPGAHPTRQGSPTTMETRLSWLGPIMAVLAGYGLALYFTFGAAAIVDEVLRYVYVILIRCT